MTPPAGNLLKSISGSMPANLSSSQHIETAMSIHMFDVKIPF